MKSPPAMSNLGHGQTTTPNLIEVLEGMKSGKKWGKPNDDNKFQHQIFNWESN